MPTTNDQDPNVLNVPPAASATSATVVPQVTAQYTTVNLANGAAINFDFNADTGPLFDCIVFADQVLTVNIFLRSGPADIYRLLDGAAYGQGVANLMKQVIRGLRLGGSNVRIQVLNNSGTPTTVLSVEVQSRSL